ncbi:MAG: PQQ-binding-like beta-propeller repeat protein [Candidatus Eremiobacteraeota bacterium]|nr:PQQ-binding-like beta-propeller repeat protein [Candidatus Eremiobacteraeota bacterium]
MRIWCAAFAASLLCLMPLSGRGASRPAVDWPTFGYDYSNSRHVPFHQINAANVKSLRLAWKFSLGTYGKFEATPIVRDGSMYLSLPPNDTVVALHASDGRVLWTYTPELAAVKLCCGPVNRGVAVDADHVYLATLDARLIALDRRTGALRWQTAVENPGAGYSETMAPLVWRDMVFIGISGGDVGIRGSFTAYAAGDGRRLWRWYTVERENGGGSVWMTPALDEAKAILYFGVGNPFPTIDDTTRPGEDLYTDSVVALDARTGTLRWYYQEVPHDQWDYDASSPPLLVDTRTADGSRLPAVAQAGKTGWLYLLARDRGTLIRKSSPFVRQQNMFARPTAQGVYASPAGGSGAIAPPAVNLAMHRAFVTAVDQLHFARFSDPYWHQAGAAVESLSAIDLDSGRIAWRHQFPPGGRIDGGLNATNGPCATDDLVFVGEESTGLFDALDPKNGALLWQFQTSAGTPGSGADLSFSVKLRDFFVRVKHVLLREPQPVAQTHIHNSPIAYIVDGVEYVAIGGDAFYRQGDSSGDTLYVFSLPH